MFFLPFELNIFLFWIVSLPLPSLFLPNSFIFTRPIKYKLNHTVKLLNTTIPKTRHIDNPIDVVNKTNNLKIIKANSSELKLFNNSK